MSTVLSCLQPKHRDRLSELLWATGAFSADEIGVALELFDEAFGNSATASAGPSLRSGRQGCHSERSEESALTVAADYEFIGAFDEENTLLGYACFGPTPQTDGTFDLYWLAVDPASQGRGAGRALVRWVENELRLRGGRLLVVETSSRAEYSQTREFYTRGGYSEAARVRDFYAPADDRIIFTTSLSARGRGVATR
jgi:ribosomal protein S18 acetylase RimI-like enzyme